MPGDETGAILSAARRRDAATLVRLYAEEADRRRAAGETDAECFFLTQAYVWALEAGHPRSADLHARLTAYGREEGAFPADTPAA